MAYVILQNCCKDASCVSACPVNCIHPAPSEGDYAEAPMLYVDPRVCIDCGACADACPVDAVVPADTLSGPEAVYTQVNADHFADVPLREARSIPATAENPTFRDWERPSFDWSLPSDFTPLEVAVVGTGPAGMYAAEHLLLHTRSRVTLIDRLPMAGGLVRYGVAPDHPHTKGIGDTFGRLFRHPRVRMLLGVEVGRDVSVAELGESFDAVIYAVGASEGRRLGVPGEGLTGSLTAPAFVGWYNGHPDTVDAPVVLDTERAVVVGTGNVALDVARILSSDVERLARTDLAESALAVLSGSRVREVVLLARRGPAEAAYSVPELTALRHLPGIELVVDGDDPAVGEAIDGASARSKAAALSGVRRTSVDLSAPPAPGRRIVLRFGSTTEALEGDDQVTGLRLTDGTRIDAGLVVTSVGYRGTGVIGLPFESESSTVPHDHGRVVGVPGSYVVGWIKRGANGGIGDNRTDAADTVRSLLDDAVAGRLPTPRRSARSLARTLRRRVPGVVDARGLARIDAAERRAGEAHGRPRTKLVTAEDLIRAARR